MKNKTPHLNFQADLCKLDKLSSMCSVQLINLLSIEYKSNKLQVRNAIEEP